jgi:hypothetical protein
VSKKRPAEPPANIFIDKKRNPGRYCTEDILGDISRAISEEK